MFKKPLLLFVASGLLLFSCTKTDTPPSNNNNNNNNNNNLPPPTVKLVIDKASASTGDAVTLSFTASSTINLKSFKMEDVLSGNTSSLDFKDSVVTGKLLAYAMVFKTGIPGSRQIKLTVTDENNQTSSDIQPLIITGGVIKPSLTIQYLSSYKLPSNAPSFTLKCDVTAADPVKNFKITRIITGQSNATVVDSNITATNFHVDKYIVAPAGYIGNITYKVTITDIRGNSDTGSQVVNVYAPLHYGTFSLDNTNGGRNFLSTPDFTTYSNANGKSHASSIDISFIYDPNQGVLICNPYLVAQAYGITSWSPLKQTMFVKTSVFGSFNTQRTGDDLKNGFENAFATPSSSAVIQGSGDEEIYFKTADGRYGVIRINEVNGSSSTGFSTRAQILCQ